MKDVYVVLRKNAAGFVDVMCVLEKEEHAKLVVHSLMTCGNEVCSEFWAVKTGIW